MCVWEGVCVCVWKCLSACVCVCLCAYVRESFVFVCAHVCVCVWVSKVLIFIRMCACARDDAATRCRSIQSHKRLYIYIYIYIYAYMYIPHQKLHGGCFSNPVPVFCLICTISSQLNGTILHRLFWHLHTQEPPVFVKSVEQFRQPLVSRKFLCSINVYTCIYIHIYICLHIYMSESICMCV